MDIHPWTEPSTISRTFSIGGNSHSFHMQLLHNKLCNGADRISVFVLGNITAKGRRELKKQSGEDIQVTDFSKLVVDHKGRLWVLGYWQVICIDPATENTIYELNVGDLKINSRTSSMDISPDGRTIYFNSARRVYTIDVDNPVVPTAPIIYPTRDDGRTVYLMTISPENTIFLSEVLYGSLSRSRIFEYDQDGTELQTFRAGIFSHFIYFN